MKINKAIKKEPIYTEEGGKASHITKLEELTRATMSCLLWENEFYEDGVSIADRIVSLTKECIDKGLYDKVIELLKKVKFDMKLRHCPLWMIVAIYKSGKTISKDVIASILTRPDDAGELIALYRKDNNKAPIPNAFKKGISLAFQKWDEYQLAKWNKSALYKLVDIVNLCHPTPTEAINKLMTNTLSTPQTWEVMLSEAGSDENKKQEAWKSLMESGKLPAMAFLKNIRGMLNCNVSKNALVAYLNNINATKLLPIDFIRSADANPTMESELENKFLNSFVGEKMQGKTALLIDVSGSMYNNWNSTIENHKYATSLAMIGREMFEDVDIYSFSNDIILIPNRHGFALRDAINRSQSHCGTYMWKSVETVLRKNNYQRLIVITDEQTADRPIQAAVNSYIINISTNKNGVGYEYGYKHINGFSDKVFEYIAEIEKMEK